jgi:hypothetical protein
MTSSPRVRIEGLAHIALPVSNEPTDLQWVE